ncbi:synaptotagmin-4-like [Centruroides sculpturatus]|uniref:synaptotagmin-4-like n=1 Tax=Centruroides sculpturatus TaxID=218467 RepID=UPI000C6EF089|nr:synaptotagmin-4-like [Centruroides sculpturatus]XP_023241238.1 synaptotagmin-4-like [Centruroides sculpturatus]
MKGWLQILIAVGSAFLAFIIIILIFVALRIRNKRKRKKEIDNIKNSHRIMLKRCENLLSTNISRQSVPNDKIPIIKTSPPRPNFPHLEVLKNNDQWDSSLSETDGEGDTPPKNKLDVDWSESENLRSESPSRTRETPTIEFSLVYVASNNTLTVHIIRVINLPLRYRKNCSSFVKVSLLARKKSSQQTQVFKKSLNPEYVQNFTFPGYSLDEIRRFTLRLSVYVKHYRLLKDKLVGEIWFPLARSTLQPDCPAILSENLSSRSLKQKRMSMCSPDLGQLFVILQYQVAANRLKVLVRKAENLPKATGVSIGQPEFYVIVSILRGIEAITYKETRPASGVNPVWNQPFLFDLPSKETEEYWLQFLIMRGRMYSRDGVVGHVLVGPGTTPTGEAHWNEAMEPKALDTAKWHNICTVDDF